MDLLADGEFDYEGIRAAINERTHLVTIQRSKGYAPRKTLSVERIGKLIAFIKDIKPEDVYKRQSPAWRAGRPHRCAWCAIRSFLWLQAASIRVGRARAMQAASCPRRWTD